MDSEIFNQLPTHVYWKDSEGTMLGLNSLDGKDASKCIGLKDDKLPWSGDWEAYRKHDLEVMNSGNKIAFTEHAQDEEGNVIECISIKAPLRDATGKIVGVTGVSFPKSLIENLKN